MSSTGIVRTATPSDALALSQLLAMARTDVVPLIPADIAAYLARGRVLVLDIDGWLVGAAHVEVDDRRARVRSLAVHPALAGRGLEHRLVAATVALCGTQRLLLERFEPRPIASPAQPRTAGAGLVRRIVYWTMLLLALPKVIASAGGNEPALAMVVWSALALVFERTPRIPRAIVHRARRRRELTRTRRDLVAVLSCTPVGRCHQANRVR